MCVSACEREGERGRMCTRALEPFQCSLLSSPEELEHEDKQKFKTTQIPWTLPTTTKKARLISSDRSDVVLAHTRAHANKITDTMKSNYRSVHVFVNGQQSHSVCVCLGVGGLQLEGFYQLFSHPESSVILTNCCPYTLAVITGPCH